MDNKAIRLVLWAGTMAAVSGYSSTLARAQTSGPPGPVSGLNGLGTQQRGQIGHASVDGAGLAIAAFDLHVMRAPRELPVAGPAAAALAPPAPGTMDGKILAAEVAARLEPLEDCRIDVARRKRVPTGEVAADRLTLRWIITKTGRAFGAGVVGTTPTDDGVLDCVKRQMAGWTFPRPSGGPFPIERSFKFRMTPPAK